MPKFEISDIKFKGLTTVVPGASDVEHWSPTRPAHDPSGGKQTCREVIGPKGETLAVFILFEAGAVVREVEVPAANIRSITRRPVIEEKPAEGEGKSGKAGAK